MRDSIGFVFCRHYTKAAESRFHIFTLTLSPRCMYQYCCSSAGRGNGSTAIELSELRQERSADFSPLPAVLAGLEGCGLKSALLDSMAEGNGRGAIPFLMSLVLEHEIVTFAWTDSASVQFPLNIYATKGSTSHRAGLHWCSLVSIR